MSKSLGTGIDPLDLIDGGPRPPVYEEGGEFPAYGADALRFGLLAMSSSQDVRFNEERVKQGRDLANKLWNASRLILLRVADVEPDARRGRDGRGPLDRVAAGAADRARDGAVDGFRFSSRRARALRRLLVRAVRLVPRARQAAPLRGATTSASRPCCCWSLERTLRLLAPGDAVRDRGDLVAACPATSAACWRWPTGRWPTSRADRRGRPRRELERLIEAVTALRRYRDEVGRQAAARRCAGGWRPTATTSCATTLGRLARFELRRRPRSRTATCSPTVPMPGGAVQVLPSDAFDAGEARAAAARRERERWHGRSSAPSASSPTSSSSSEGARRGGGRRSGASSTEYREALRRAGDE